MTKTKMAIIKDWRIFNVNVPFIGDDSWKKRWPNFMPHEFDSPDTHSVRMYVKVLDGLQAIRNEFGPLIITSGYRTPEYNAQIGGGINSQHLLGLAADIDIPLDRDWETI